ncbi:hypothetical protein TorRG33x02_150450 [Trema orientale]|uniref:Uncharacterized protein n=1 Tax=Trema orientale TaxID=63057 RepID=A0A2P5EUG5_TREOI|nr:hypothetical protein TorRG33x02_150450 [Trema orientale]
MAYPLWTTVGVCRWVRDRMMSMKSFPFGTTVIFLKLYCTMSTDYYSGGNSNSIILKLLASDVDQRSGGGSGFSHALRFTSAQWR